MVAVKNNTTTWLLAGLLILFILQLINRILLCTSYNSDLGGIETSFVYYIQRALDHQPYYQSPENAPYFLHQYQPIYTFSVSKILELIGVRSTDVHSVFVGARVFNLLINLLTIWVLYVCLRKLLRCSIYVSTASAILMFLAFFVHNYAVRSDSLKSLLVLLAVYFIIKGYRSEKKILNILLAAFFLACATYTKQDAFSYLFIFPISLWLIREKKLALRSWFMSSMMVLLVLSILWTIYGYQYWNNVVNGLQQGLSWDYFAGIFSKSLMPVLFIGILTWLLYRMKSPTESGKDILFLYLISASSFCVAVVSLLKWGSAAVYFADFCIFGFLLLGILLKNANGRTLIVCYISILAILAFDLISNYRINKIIYIPATEQSYKNEYLELQELRSLIVSELEAPGIICLNKALTNHLYPYCFFSTFEHEFPQYIYCTDMRMVSAPNVIYNYPKAQICEQAKVYLVNKSCENMSPLLNMQCLTKGKADHVDQYVLYRLER